MAKSLWKNLYALLYLIYKELKNIDPSEDLNFYINLKTKLIKITYFNETGAILDIIDNLVYYGLIDLNVNSRDKIYLTEYRL